MGKRFEETRTPSFVDVVTAYRLLGLENLLGEEGYHTAIAGDIANEDQTCYVVPGKWTQDEFRQLLAYAA